MTATTIGHDEALDLVADSLDFPLSSDERDELEDHLRGCSSCSRVASRMARDDQLLEEDIRWEDEERDQSEGDEDLEGWGGDPVVSTRDDSDDEDDEDDEDGDHLKLEPRDDDEDDEDDESPIKPLGSASGGTNESEKDDDDDEDDDDDRRDDSSTDGRAGITAGGHSEDDVEDLADDLVARRDEGDESLTSEETEDISRAARKEADEAGDDDLADIEDDADDPSLSALDDLFPTCTAEGINDIAVSDTLRREIERKIRDEESVSTGKYGKVAVYKSTRGLTKGRTAAAERPRVAASAARQIRNAILRSRTGTTAVERYQTRGKLDGKSLHRVAARDDRLFKRNVSPDPGKFLVWVLVDVSGSMNGTPMADAATVARALADASSGAPTVRLEVWAWSSPFDDAHNYYSRKGGYNANACVAGVARVWNRQVPTSEIFRLTQLQPGGTPDAATLDWAWRNILKQKRSDEQPVIIMCSDGFGDHEMPEVIRAAQKHGVSVKSVALGRYITESEQETRFGRGNYVPWQGSMEATARPLADMIARMAQGK